MTFASKIITFDDFMKDYDPSKNVSVSFMTIYEKTSIFGMRKQQIENQAPINLTDSEKKQLKNIDDLDEVVSKEMELKRIPFIVERVMPDKTVEYFRIEDLLML